MKKPRGRRPRPPEPTEEELTELDALLARLGPRLPVAYACIAKAVDSPQDGAMLALLVARHFCDMVLDPPLKLEKLVAVVAELTFVPDKPGVH